MDRKFISLKYRSTKEKWTNRLKDYFTQIKGFKGTIDWKFNFTQIQDFKGTIMTLD